jgi:hypothetical protein
MNYFFTTLAVGEPYFSKSIETYTQMHEKTEDGFFNITTSAIDLESFEEKFKISLDDFLLKYPKLQITKVEDFFGKCNFPFHMEGAGFTFNLNFKVLALKACFNSGKSFEYLIFADGDWGITDGFSEEKIQNFFSQLKLSNIDMAFERPAKIGNYRKTNFQDCFFMEKLKDYNVFEHTVWDEAEVVNEQFLGFQNNWKLRLFVQKWEQMLWFSIVNNIRNYPDGFEIGVAAVESQMNTAHGMFYSMNNCFYFYPRPGSAYETTKFIKF